MWDTISRMAGDRLWIYTSIAGSILGALFLAYMKGTKVGLWTYMLWDKSLDRVRDKFGIRWLDQPTDAWRTIDPGIAAKIDELETRIKRLEDR